MQCMAFLFGNSEIPFRYRVLSRVQINRQPYNQRDIYQQQNE